MIDLIPAILGVYALIGVALSVDAMRSFNLRHWKQATSFFTASLGLFSILMFMKAYHGITVPLRFESILVAAVIIFITVGIYYLKQTARTVGA